MTSGADLATRATPPDLIEDAGDRAAPDLAEAATRPGGADARRQPHAMPLPASDGRRDRAGAPARWAPAGEAVSERYLAPALKAAAAARARSARIRADAAAVSAPRDAGPAGRSLPPADLPAPAELVTASPGVKSSCFRSPPPNDRPGPADLPAPAALRARAPEPGPPPAPAQPVAAEPARGSGAQRFARTVAELERSLAANRSREAGSGLVPRPTLPLVDPEPSGRAWLRLWSRLLGRHLDAAVRVIDPALRGLTRGRSDPGARPAEAGSGPRDRAPAETAIAGSGRRGRRARPRASQ
jgi:hypothetical protein